MKPRGWKEINLVRGKLPKVKITINCHWFANRWRFGFRIEEWNGETPKKKKCFQTGASKKKVFRRTTSHSPPWILHPHAHLCGKCLRSRQVRGGGIILQEILKDWLLYNHLQEQIHRRAHCICILTKTLQIKQLHHQPEEIGADCKLNGELRLQVSSLLRLTIFGNCKAT